MAEVLLFGDLFSVTDAEIPQFLISELALAVADEDQREADAALMRVLKVCIAPGDWSRFRKAAIKADASGDALVGVIEQVTAARRGVEVVTGRPFEQPSSFSVGPDSTEASSTDGSSSPVIRRLEQQGRPELAQVVALTQTARAAG